MPSPVYLDCSAKVKGDKVKDHAECTHGLFYQGKQINRYGHGEYLRALSDKAALRQKHDIHKYHVKRNEKVHGCELCCPSGQVKQEMFSMKLSNFIPKIAPMLSKLHKTAEGTPVQQLDRETIYDQTRAFKYLKRELGDIDMPPSQEDIDIFQLKLSERRLQPRSINHYCRDIKAVLRKAKANKIFPVDIELPKIGMLEVGKKRKIAYSDFQKLKLLKVAGENDVGKNQKFDLFLVGAVLFNALRFRDIIVNRKNGPGGLHGKQIDLEKGLIYPSGKTEKGEERVLPIHPYVKQLLLEWPEPIEPDKLIIPWVADYVYHRLGEIWEKAGVPGTPYSARGSAGTDVGRIKGLSVAQHTLRHQDPKTSSEYYLSVETDEIADAFKQSYQKFLDHANNNGHDNETNALEMIMALLEKFPNIRQQLLQKLLANPSTKKEIFHATIDS